MNYWIFQSVVDRYDLRDDKIVEIGKSDTWYATRYKSKMKEGDRVYFWLGGLGSERETSEYTVVGNKSFLGVLYEAVE
ncbi:EVE domain-containing protein [Alkalimonas amylolytica]|uniref:EVE domain-containing protein n=1 Tax=Alkalimonas amylolytica TaxID=152573 RepID=A0A1H4FYL0_ALKAM|nr:EVE domain-containing protein [Alkalimonas amylolytica]SEB01910.1 EVE domain-containing protein [Alkalimonas amylolytica]